MHTFAEVLQPLEVQRFLREVYGFSPFYCEGTRGRFEYLLGWDDLNRILRQQPFEWPRMRLARAGKLIPKEELISKENASHSRLDLIAFSQHLRDGAMLVIDRIDQWHDPVTQLCQMAEWMLCDSAEANAYAGWHSTPGFDTHWDDHDAFVIQVIGSKSWRVFRPTRRFPFPQDRRSKLPPPTVLYWEGMLRSGDTLYIPRGWWHDARPVNEPTLHLTLSIARHTGEQFLRSVLEKLRENELIRADLPRFASSEERQNYVRQLTAIACDALSRTALDDYFYERDIAALGRARPSLPWCAVPHECLGKHTWIHWLPPRPIPLQVKEGQLNVTAMGKVFHLAQQAQPLVACLAELRNVRFEELCARHPNVAAGAIEAFIKKIAIAGLVAISQGETY